MKRRGSVAFVVALIVVVVLAAVGGIWYYESHNSSSSFSSPNATSKSIGQEVGNALMEPSSSSSVWTFDPSQPVAATTTQGWNSYENATGTFSLLYPPGYTPYALYGGTSVDASILAPAPDSDGAYLFNVSTYPGESEQDFSSWENSQISGVASTSNEIVTTSTATVAGYPALKVVFADTDQPRTEYFVSPNSEFHVQITEFYNTAYVSVGAPVLSLAQLQANKAMADAMLASLKLNTVSSATPSTAPQAGSSGTTITIASPSGGEAFSMSAKITLQWSAADYTGNTIGLLFVPANETPSQIMHSQVGTQDILNIGDMMVTATEENLTPGSYYVLMYIPCNTQPDCPDYAYTKPFMITQ